MAIINAFRNGKDWVCLVGTVELYRGPSANKAQDLADALMPKISAGAKAEYKRLPVGDKTSWATIMDGVVIDDFGSSANKAADLAEKINEALGVPGAAVQNPNYMARHDAIHDDIAKTKDELADAGLPSSGDGL